MRYVYTVGVRNATDCASYNISPQPAIVTVSTWWRNVLTNATTMRQLLTYIVVPFVNSIWYIVIVISPIEYIYVSANHHFYFNYITFGAIARKPNLKTGEHNNAFKTFNITLTCWKLAIGTRYRLCMMSTIARYVRHGQQWNVCSLFASLNVNV